MNKKPALFQDDESDSDTGIKINNEYASHYDTWRQKEEFNKLKTKYGDHVRTYELSDDDSSSSEDEDEDGKEFTEELEKDFFKTLSCLKNKDPKIYDENVVFFEDKKNEQTNTKENKKIKKTKPMFLKDYERKMILEKGAKFEDSDEEESVEPRSNSPTYVQQQQELKESLKKNVLEEDNDDENLGGLLSKRQKTPKEQENEEEDYRKWLKGSKEQLENKEEEMALKPLKEYWTKPDLDEKEKFLRDYLLNKRYVEKEDQNHIPTYEEIVHDSDEGLSEDEEQIEKQDEFEHKYNFRFEEPDQDFIKRYPRTMEQSVRKTDDRRKLKRQEIKERKLEEKKEKLEELKQLKVYKRKEIEEKINMLKKITGNEDMAFQNEDLDADFDPAEHDKRMHELFDDQYYEGEEGDIKPEWEDFEEELGPWKDNNEPHCEDDDFNMDADYDPSMAAPKKNKKEKKKRNRLGKQSKNKDDLDDLPIDKNDERYEEYMDELYKLDCEDMIGDMPCRFKYREVVPNDFGLSIEEILLAKDKELNSWCSLKKTMQYRPEHMEKYDVLAYKRKAMDDTLKKKFLPSIYDDALLQEDAAKEEQVAKMNFVDSNENEEIVIDKKDKRSKRQKRNQQDEEEFIEKSDTNEKKNKKKKQKGKPNKSETSESQENEQTIQLEHENNNETKKKNKYNTSIENTSTNKKKRKHSGNEVEETGTDKETISLENENNIVTKKKSKKNKNITVIENTSSNKQNQKHSDNIVEETIPLENENNIVTKKKSKKNNITIENTSSNKKKRKNSGSVVEETDIDKETIPLENENNIATKKNKNIKLLENTSNNKKKRKHSSSEVKETGADKNNTTKPEGLTRRQKKNKRKLMTKSKETSVESKPQKETRKRKLSTQETGDSANNNPKKKQKFNKSKRKENSNTDLPISNSRLEAYGINPKKFKNKLKYKNKTNLKTNKKVAQ